MDTPPSSLPPAEAYRLQLKYMALVPVAILVAALYFGRPVLVPLSLATLLAFVLAPLVARLRLLGLGRAGSVAIAVVLAASLLGSLAAFIGAQAENVAEELPLYRNNLIEKIQSIRGTAIENGVIGRTSSLLNDLRSQILGATRGQRPRPPNQFGVRTGPGPVLVQIQEAEPTPLELMRPLFSELISAGIVVVFVIFILLQKEDLRDRFVRLAGAGAMQRTTLALDDGAQRLSRYLLTQTVMNASFGFVISIGLWLIGIPNPSLWGVVVAILRFVPYVGVPIAALLPTALALAVDPGWWMVIETIALFFVTEILVGQLIEPWLYGQRMGLSPAAVVISATFWTSLWGPVGLLLATPLTMCLVVLGRYVEHLQFLDVLLGNRPVLATEEALYLRLLGEKADEAAADAEEFLTQNSLCSYFDERLLKALCLAQIDVNRGRLDYDRQLRIKDTVRELIQNLADRGEQTEPASVNAVSQPVLCVAGRGPLDEAATLLLAQVLEECGIATKLVSSSDLSALQGENKAIICVSYLEAGRFNSARYLLRRVQRLVPDGVAIVGLWNLSREDPRYAAATSGLGGNVVTMLGTAVERIQELANSPLPPDTAPVRLRDGSGTRTKVPTP
jgi:predicted PurR-regulated permease PerM